MSCGVFNSTGTPFSRPRQQDFRRFARSLHLSMDSSPEGSDSFVLWWLVCRLCRSCNLWFYYLLGKGVWGFTLKVETNNVATITMFHIENDRLEINKINPAHCAELLGYGYSEKIVHIHFYLVRV